VLALGQAALLLLRLLLPVVVDLQARSVFCHKHSIYHKAAAFRDGPISRPLDAFPPLHSPTL
jgi:hypothetical protein